MATQELRLKATADTKQAQSNLKKLDSGVSGIIKTVAGATAAFYAAKKAIDFMAGSVDLLQADITELKKSEAIIKATGGVAEVTVSQVEDLAQSIQDLTGISNTEIIAAENMILTFKNINQNIFPETIRILADMTTMFGSAQASAIQVGKALNDPIRGVTALTRSGITFTDQQKEQIKVMQESGNIYGAQRIILDELKSQFEGLAAASATNVKKMQSSFDDFRKMLAADLLPIVENVAGGLDSFFKSFTETSLDKSIRELKQFGAAAEDILKFEKFAMSRELIEVNKELDKSKLNYKSISDVMEEVDGIQKRAIELTKIRIEKEKKSKFSIEEVKAVYRDIGLSQEEVNSKVKTYTEAINSGNFLTPNTVVLNALDRQVDAYQDQLGLLAKNKDLLIEREALTKNIAAAEKTISGELDLDEEMQILIKGKISSDFDKRIQEKADSFEPISVPINLELEDLEDVPAFWDGDKVQDEFQQLADMWGETSFPDAKLFSDDFTEQYQGKFQQLSDDWGETSFPDTKLFPDDFTEQYQGKFQQLSEDWTALNEEMEEVRLITQSDQILTDEMMEEYDEKRQEIVDKWWEMNQEMSAGFDIPAFGISDDFTEQYQGKFQQLADDWTALNEEMEEVRLITQSDQILTDEMMEEYDERRQEIIDKWWEMNKEMSLGFDVIESGFDSVVDDMLSGTATIQSTMENAFAAMGKSAVNLLVEWLKEKAKVAIAEKAMQATSSATSVATAATTGAGIAASYAPAAVMASLATAGANSIPAQAGITSTFAIAQGLTFAETGFEGTVNSPQMFMVGEKNKAEDVIVDPLTGGSGGASSIRGLLKELIQVQKAQQLSTSVNVAVDPISGQQTVIADMSDEGNKLNARWA